MIPVVTADEARAMDAAAPVPVEVLVERAGWAVARQALDLLGGAYGRRVVVIAGKGNNGADGRVAARHLARRGVRVEVVDAAKTGAALPRADLVVDAAYGTGFRGTWEPPRTAAPVLAVDIPSGVDSTTGAVEGAALRAVRTVTFAALKPGLLLGEGADLSGDVVVVDIGLDASAARSHLVEDGDVVSWLPPLQRDAHKWQRAVCVVAGGPGMSGAASLVVRGAQRAGAGYVRLATPGVADPARPVEAVAVAVDERGWWRKIVGDLGRIGAVVVGPGLGPGAADDVRELVGRLAVPVVVDADGLRAFSPLDGGLPRDAVLTPHEGEAARLLGESVGADRFAAARALSARAGCTVLLKGPTTFVAAPSGEVLVASAGTPALATAGTGDVLAGVIGALLARGLPPLRAAAAAAHVHGRAASRYRGSGLVAGDLPDLLGQVLVEPEGSG